MKTPLHNALLAAVLVAGAGWSLPVEPGRSADGPATPVLIASPAFAISARRGTVTVTGHTSSRRHEAQLRRAVERHFPGRAAVFEFRPYGPAPDWWVRATTGLVAAIAVTRKPRARLDDQALVVRALAQEPATASERVSAVARALPVSLDTDIRILDTGPDIAVRSLCDRHFANFRNGPIRFIESQTVMRPSARPELERVVALATACRDARIMVTGHTDASGNEAWNRALSRERARTVGDWLVARGVNADRIAFEGAGSSEPVASNETRYGRSLNRRINIGFAYED